jgi:hypothetical protein
VTLKIPRPLYERLQTLIEGTGFSSVTEFAVYVLRDVASVPERSQPAAAPGDLTEKELDAIRTRLKRLGYL